MSLLTTASLWTNDDNQKKRTPTMRRTIKLKPNISTSSEPDEYVSQNEKFLRAEELKYLKGDSTKIRTTLGWSPEYSFETLMDDMIDHWLNIYSK
jgi:GDP-D-mannose dehydratase